MSRFDHDVAIVGGGLVGASSALLFKKAMPDLSVTLIESKPLEQPSSLPSFDQRTTAISPTTQEAFCQMGIWQALSPVASSIETIHVSDKGQLGQATMGPQDNAGQPLGYVLQNSRMGEVLLKTLGDSDTCIRSPETVTQIRPLAGGVALTLGSGQCVTARLLIVADGAESALRKQLGIAYSDHDYEQHAIVANVRFSAPHQNTAYERFTSHGPMALLPLKSDDSREATLVWTWPANDVARVKAMSDEDFLNGLQMQFGYRLGQFQAVSARSVYPLCLRLAKEQVRSNVVLLGNAAHFLHPVAGQGFNLSMRDALRLVSLLRNVPKSTLGDLAILQRYEAIQAKDQASTTILSHTFNQGFRNARWGVPHIRSFGFFLFESIPLLREQLIAHLSGRIMPKASVGDL